MLKGNIDRFVISRVEEMRVEAGLSQFDLSQKLGMSSSFISHIETPEDRHNTISIMLMP